MVISSGSVTYSSIVRQVHANIYNMINTRVNVPDPRMRDGSRKFVYQKEPKVTSMEFQGYPYVKVPSPSVSVNNASLDKSRESLSWHIPVRVVTTDTTEGRKDKGSQDSDTIAENIKNTFDNETNRLVLHDYGLLVVNTEIGEVSADYDEKGNDTYSRIVDLSIRGSLAVR